MFKQLLNQYKTTLKSTNVQQMAFHSGPIPCHRSGWEIFKPRKIHIGSYWRGNNKVVDITLYFVLQVSSVFFYCYLHFFNPKNLHSKGKNAFLNIQIFCEKLCEKSCLCECLPWKKFQTNITVILTRWGEEGEGKLEGHTGHKVNSCHP